MSIARDAEAKTVPDSAEGGFTYVSRAPRKGKARRGRRGPIEVNETPEARLNKRLEIIKARREELEGQIPLQHFLEKAFPCHRSGDDGEDKKSGPSLRLRSIIALGLGSVKDTRPAQIQLALLLITRDHMEGARSSEKPHVSAYDPICDDEDAALLKALGITSLTSNDQGCYPIDEATLFYMPHCPRELYENVLRANWTSDRLSLLMLCCNELERYTGGIAASQHSSPCLERIVRHLDTLPVPPLSDVAGHALSDLAVQRFAPPSASIDHSEVFKAGETSLQDALINLKINGKHGQNDTAKGAQDRATDLPADFWTLPDKAPKQRDAGSELV